MRNRCWSIFRSLTRMSVRMRLRRQTEEDTAWTQRQLTQTRKYLRLRLTQTRRLQRGSTEDNSNRGPSKDDSRGSSDEDYCRWSSKEDRPVREDASWYQQRNCLTSANIWSRVTEGLETKTEWLTDCQLQRNSTQLVV